MGCFDGRPRAGSLRVADGRDVLIVIYSLWLLCIRHIVGYVLSLVVVVGSFRFITQDCSYIFGVMRDTGTGLFLGFNATV